MKRIGLDVDGVLADFNTSFIRLIISVTGRDLFPPRPFDIPTWDYSEHYGYTSSEMSKVWQDIKDSPDFWASLPPYAGVKNLISLLKERKDDVYFITSRPGQTAKAQTEEWLELFNVIRPTVLICSEKGLAAKALDLDIYVDDRTENYVDVLAQSPNTAVIRMIRPWNKHVDGTWSVQTLEEVGQCVNYLSSSYYTCPV